MRTDRFDFEDLAVFQRSLDLLEVTDRYVTHFRGHRKSLAFQMFGSASSIVLNIAESRRRRTVADRAHFLDIANGSASETAGALCAADRLLIGPPETRQKIRHLLLEIIAMLTAMARKLRNRSPPRP